MFNYVRNFKGVGEVVLRDPLVNSVIAYRSFGADKGAVFKMFIDILKRPVVALLTKLSTTTRAVCVTSFTPWHHLIPRRR